MDRIGYILFARLLQTGTLKVPLTKFTFSKSGLSWHHMTSLKILPCDNNIQKLSDKTFQARAAASLYGKFSQIC